MGLANGVAALAEGSVCDAVRSMNELVGGSTFCTDSTIERTSAARDSSGSSNGRADSVTLATIGAAAALAAFAAPELIAAPPSIPDANVAIVSVDKGLTDDGAPNGGAASEIGRTGGVLAAGVDIPPADGGVGDFNGGNEVPRL